MNKIQEDYTKYMEIQRIVALNLAKARGPMSRKELADKAGLSYQHIYEIEEKLKKPSLKVLEKVAKALDIEIFTLLREEGAPPPTKTEPLSIFASKLQKIPDSVFEKAQALEASDEVWKTIENLLEVAKMAKTEKANHA